MVMPEPDKCPVTVEIDWIEIVPTEGNDKEKQLWDFGDAADPMKPRPGKLSEEKGTGR